MNMKFKRQAPLQRFILAVAFSLGFFVDAIAADLPPYDALVIRLRQNMQAVEMQARNDDGVAAALQQLRQGLPGLTEEFTPPKSRGPEALQAFQRHRLDRYYEVDVSRMSCAEAEAMLDRVRGNPLLDYAVLKEFAVTIDDQSPADNLLARDSTPPDYTTRQHYLYSPISQGSWKIGGINAAEAWKYPGGKGDQARIFSMENGKWSQTHMDLPQAFHSYGTPHVPDDYHDTSAVGIMASLENGFGTTGIAPRAQAAWIKWSVINLEANLEHIQSGDVLQIGIHYLVSALAPIFNCGSTCYVPMEYFADTRDLLAYMVQEKGVHVVFAAANGNIDLDHPHFNGIFDRNRNDTGTIYAGAADPITGLRTDSSDYGSRVDTWSWGNYVTTTTAPDHEYSHTFSGTSSANPIIAGAVATLQSVARARGIGNLPPKVLRQYLIHGGSPLFNGNSSTIGVQPNLKAAIDKLYADYPEGGNRPPMGEIGAPAEIASGETFTVHVQAHDPDNDTLSFQWATASFQPASGTTQMLMLTAPQVTDDTLTSVSVALSDGHHAVPLSQNITVKKASHPAPVARIAGPGTVAGAAVLALSGSSSSGEGLRYSWSAPGFTPATATNATVTLTAPASAGARTVTLTVRDAHDASHSVDHAVMVQAGEQPGCGTVLAWSATKTYSTYGEQVAHLNKIYKQNFQSTNMPPDIHSAPWGEPWVFVQDCAGE